MTAISRGRLAVLDEEMSEDEDCVYFPGIEILMISHLLYQLLLECLLQAQLFQEHSQ